MQGSSQKTASLAGTQDLQHSTLTMSTETPNPSFEARPNIKMPGPQSGLAHFPQCGPVILLSVPPQLER